MSKYEPLTHFLSGQPATEVPMTFGEIERVLGVPLPDSKRHPAWWSNNPSNNVMTRAWLKAGFRTERVDIAGERLVFRRQGKDAEPRPRAEDAPPLAGFFDGVRARLGGTVRVAPGVDLTQPTGAVWDATL